MVTPGPGPNSRTWPPRFSSLKEGRPTGRRTRGASLSALTTWNPLRATPKKIVSCLPCPLILPFLGVFGEGPKGPLSPRAPRKPDDPSSFSSILYKASGLTGQAVALLLYLLYEHFVGVGELLHALRLQHLYYVVVVHAGLL